MKSPGKAHLAMKSIWLTLSEPRFVCALNVRYLALPLRQWRNIRMQDSRSSRPPPHPALRPSCTTLLCPLMSVESGLELLSLLRRSGDKTSSWKNKVYYWLWREILSLNWVFIKPIQNSSIASSYMSTYDVPICCTNNIVLIGYKSNTCSDSGSGAGPSLWTLLVK